MEKLPPQSTISGMLKRNGVILKVDGGKGRNIKSQNSISKSAYVPTAPKPLQLQSLIHLLIWIYLSESNRLNVADSRMTQSLNL